MTASTDVSLREYFEAILDERDKALKIALEAAREAVNKAEENAEKWRNNANEWRGAMNDRELTFMRKDEFDTYRQTVDKSLDDMKAQQLTVAGRREGSKDSWGYVVGVIGLIATVVGIISTIIGIIALAIAYL